MASTESTPLTHSESGLTFTERARNALDCGMSPKNKLATCAGIWGLLTGMERAIIFPTLWLYFFKIFSVQAAVTYYGITLAAFNLSVLISSPLYGFLSHRGVPVKLLMLISNQLEIVGNVIYFLAGHPWLVLIGRFVAGLGGGSEVSLYADIVRATTRAERTPLIVVLLLARQFGLIIGPAATLIMHPINLKVGKVSFNVYNMPGLFMAILWAVLTIVILLMYPNIPKASEDVVTEPEDEKQKSEKDDKLLSSSESSTTRRKKTAVNVHNMTMRQSLQYYLKWEISATLVCTFTSYFALMALEAILPPVTKEYFKWDEVKTAYVYLVCGISVIIISFVLRMLSKCVEDRILLMSGLGVIAVGYLYITGVTVAINDTEKTLYISLLLVGIGFHVLGLPFVVACSESLYTKMIPVSDVDRGQSYLRFVINISILIGPYVGGSLQGYPYIVFVVMSLLVGISIVICTVAYNGLKIDNNDEVSS